MDLMPFVEVGTECCKLQTVEKVEAVDKKGKRCMKSKTKRTNEMLK